MTMTVDDQAAGFIWANQSWGLSNSGNSSENKERLENMKPTNQKEGNEGEALVNKKRSRGIFSGNDNNGEEGKDIKCHESDHEVHIWTERERRTKMKNMFSSLHALLPHLPSKVDKFTIVDEAVNHIKKLQQTVEQLEKQKQKRLQPFFGCESIMANSQWHPYVSREAFIADHQGSSNDNLSTVMATSSVPQLPVAFQTWSSPNLVLNICGDGAQFCICAAKKRNLLTKIAFVLDRYNIDVISAHISCKNNGNVYMILVQPNRASHLFQDAKTVEKIYIQAAKEIEMWIA